MDVEGKEDSMEDMSDEEKKNENSGKDAWYFIPVWVAGLMR
jgi:hypothetical protein